MARDKFTAEVRKTILDALQVGGPLTAACRAAGVTTMAYSKWKALAAEETEDGAPRHPEHAAFVEACEVARGNAMMGLVTDWRKLGQDRAFKAPDGTVAKFPGSAIAIRTFAERMFPEEFAPKPVRLEHSGKDGGPIFWNVTSEEAAKMSSDQIRAMLEAENEVHDESDEEAEADDDGATQTEPAQPPDAGDASAAGE